MAYGARTLGLGGIRTVYSINRAMDKWTPQIQSSSISRVTTILPSHARQATQRILFLAFQLRLPGHAVAQRESYTQDTRLSIACYMPTQTMFSHSVSGRGWPILPDLEAVAHVQVDFPIIVHKLENQIHTNSLHHWAMHFQMCRIYWRGLLTFSFAEYEPLAKMPLGVVSSSASYV